MATHQITGTYRRAPEEKRERLLAAARTLFAKQGFEDTSTQQIARMAGVSEGILFHHFGSKKALFEAIAEDFVRAGAQAAIPPDAAHLTEEVVVRAAFDFADANPALYRMLARVSATLGDPDMTARSDIIVDAIRKNLEMLDFEAQVIGSDAVLYLRRNRGLRYDLVFMDPPYSYKRGGEVVKQLLKALAPGTKTLLVHERYFMKELPDWDAPFEVLRRKRYGQTEILYVKL